MKTLWMALALMGLVVFFVGAVMASFQCTTIGLEGTIAACLMAIVFEES